MFIVVIHPLFAASSIFRYTFKIYGLKQLNHKSFDTTAYIVVKTDLKTKDTRECKSWVKAETYLMQQWHM